MKTTPCKTQEDAIDSGVDLRKDCDAALQQAAENAPNDK